MKYSSGAGNEDDKNQTQIGKRPSWSQDTPPATEPTLPPIRSANPHASSSQPGTSPLIQPKSNSQSLIAAHRTVKHDVATTISNGNKDVEVATPRRAALGQPLIISGSGNVAHLAPITKRKPRSRAMQVTLASLAACVVIAILYAATPLTAEATGRVNPFTGSASIFALPTTTPTPTPLPTATPVPPPPAPVVSTGGGGTYANPGSQAIINEIIAIFGPYAQGALNIARCESGYDPNAWNGIPILGSHASGVFQILYPITWNSTSYSGYSPYNADANIHAAYQIFVRDGYSWREWECRA